MQTALHHFKQFFTQVPSLLRKNRLLYWILFLVATGIVGFGMTKARFEVSLDSWFSADDPIKISQNQFKNLFGGDEPVFLVYRAKDGDVFSDKSLKAVYGIREDLLNYRQNEKAGESSPLGHITKIDTIVSASALESVEDSLISKQFIGLNFPSTESERAKIRQKAMDHPSYPLTYFSENNEYGGILIRTDFGTIPLDLATTGTDPLASEEELNMEDDETFEQDDISMDWDQTLEDQPIKFKQTDLPEYVDFMAAVNTVLAKDEYATQFEFFSVGNPALMDYQNDMLMEMGGLYMGMLAVMLLVLWVLFRSLSAVIWPVIIVVLSSVWMVGLGGWIGLEFSTMIMITVILLIAIGIADSVHILSGYLFFRRQDYAHHEALEAAFHKSGVACLLTSLTTMIGMLALTLTPIQNIAGFGYTSALGVGLAFLFTIFLMPLLLDLWHPNAKEVSESSEGAKKSHRIPKILGAVLPFVEKRPVAISVLFSGLFLLFLYGGSILKIDTNIVESTKKGTPLRTAYEVVDQFMMGTQNMEWLIQTGVEDALKDPKVLKAIDDAQTMMETRYKRLITNTSSLADVVKDSFQVLNQGRPEMYKIPENAQQLAQTLFLFNNANPTDRRLLVTDDYSTTHISVQIYNAGTYEYANFFKEANVDIQQIFAPLKTDYPELSVELTGTMALMFQLMDYMGSTQVKSFALALSIISILLIFIFGSLKIGLISVLPNLLPSIITFGLMGLIDLPLDITTILIAPVIIGIAVDDTIHFITHYRIEFHKHFDIRRALENTIMEAGQAILFTTLILGLGFIMLSFSSDLGMVRTGIFGSLAIFSALICDLFLLPALILIFQPKFGLKAKPSTLQAA